MGAPQAAAVKAWPALLLTSISWWLCHEPGLSFAIGGSLFALAIGLFWYGVSGARSQCGNESRHGAFAVRVAYHSYLPPMLHAEHDATRQRQCGLGVACCSASIRRCRSSAMFSIVCQRRGSISGMLAAFCLADGACRMAAGVLWRRRRGLYRHAHA